VAAVKPKKVARLEGSSASRGAGSGRLTLMEGPVAPDRRTRTSSVPTWGTWVTSKSQVPPSPMGAPAAPREKAREVLEVAAVPLTAVLLMAVPLTAVPLMALLLPVLLPALLPTTTALPLISKLTLASVGTDALASQSLSATATLGAMGAAASPPPTPSAAAQLPAAAQRAGSACRTMARPSAGGPSLQGRLSALTRSEKLARQGSSRAMGAADQAPPR